MSLPEALQRRLDAVNAHGDLAGVVRRRVPELRQRGREFEALCPFHDERTASFTVNEDKGFFHCFGCGAHGDAVRFVADFDGLDFTAALAMVEGEFGLSAPSANGASSSGPGPAVKRESRKAPQVSGRISSAHAGMAVWQAAMPARFSPVVRYLRERRLDPAATGLIDVLRYHSACPLVPWKNGQSPETAPRRCPAMLAPICRIEGDPGARRWVQQGVHITFLDEARDTKMRFAPWTDRQGRVRTPPSRVIWGTLAGGAVPVPPPIWQEGVWHDAEWLGSVPSLPLVVAEGLESTVSLMMRLGVFRGGAATLSLNNLQGYPLMDGPPSSRGGARSLPLTAVRADRSRPPFLIRDAGAVAIGVDADMKGLKNRLVQERPRAAPIRRDLTGAERTDLCGQLAAAHWRAVGAATVTICRPRAGLDFNDTLERA